MKPVKATGGVLRGLFATPIHMTIAPLPSPPGNPGASTPRPGEGSSEHHTQNSGATGSPASRPGPKQPKRRERKSGSNNHQPAHSVQNDSHMPDVSLDKGKSSEYLFDAISFVFAHIRN